MARKNVIPFDGREASLKRRLRDHLKTLGFAKSEDGELRIDDSGKETIRALHRAQREERLKASREFLQKKSPHLLKYFAAGSDIDPARIAPELERVSASTWQGDLFRLASLTWSVPVSNGFGRRIRYLVWDRHNDKLIGLIAIGDPVFNLTVRDEDIGWTARDRSARLVNIMDAYVLGAVPPYNVLLGGKLVATLVRTRDVYDDFVTLYGDTEGIISKEKKGARLLAVTTSSSMGRSSIYNRLKLGGTQYFQPLGYTRGWGHFHIPDRLFSELRNYLRSTEHHYADHHQFGQGPNWRLRTTRAALDKLGLRDDMLKHGIQREVFVCWMAANAKAILKSGRGKPDINSLLSVDEVGELAVDRWMIPRAARRPNYESWTRDNLIDLLGRQTIAVRREVAKAAKKKAKTE